MQFLSIIIWGVCIYAFFKSDRKNKSGKEEAVQNYTSICDDVDSLIEKKQQLQAVEELIVAIQLCSPDEHISTFNLSYADALGEHTVSFSVDGQNDVSQKLLETALSERERLRCSLAEKIKNIHGRCNANGNANGKNTDRRGVL